MDLHSAPILAAAAVESAAPRDPVYDKEEAIATRADVALSLLKRINRVKVGPQEAGMNIEPYRTRLALWPTICEAWIRLPLHRAKRYARAVATASFYNPDERNRFESILREELGQCVRLDRLMLLIEVAEEATDTVKIVGHLLVSNGTTEFLMALRKVRS